MKKIISYILLLATITMAMPYNILAETTDVGVNITGSVSIDVVTTISADITLDLTTGETTPTYMEIKNNSNVPVDVKITDISTTSEGAPSTFVGANDKDWTSLSESDTSTFVNFNILGEGQNVTPKDILADTELELGALDLYPSNGREYESMLNSDYTMVSDFLISKNISIYEINANFGRNWSDGDKNFTYQITTVYSKADEYVEESYVYPEMTPTLEKINSVSLLADTIMLEGNFSGKTTNEGTIPGGLDFELLDYNIIFNINGKEVDASVSEGLHRGSSIPGDGTFESTTVFSFPIDTLPEGTYYLKTLINFESSTYTYISKSIISTNN